MFTFNLNASLDIFNESAVNILTYTLTFLKYNLYENKTDPNSITCILHFS